jgi:hypothetical protein
MQGGVEHHRQRIRVGRQEPLQLIVLGQAEGRQSRRAAGFVKLGREVAKPGHGLRPILARRDDLAN